MLRMGIDALLLLHAHLFPATEALNACLQNSMFDKDASRRSIKSLKRFPSGPELYGSFKQACTRCNTV